MDVREQETSLADPSNKRVRKAKPETVVKTTREPSATSLKRRMRLMEGKRTLILDAALEIFSRYGVHGSSLDQVASLADVSRPTCCITSAARTTCT